MANRSDISAALPRFLKRMITMGRASGNIKDAHHEGDVRRLFVKAHANYRNYKQNKRLPAELLQPVEGE